MKNKGKFILIIVIGLILILMGMMFLTLYNSSNNNSNTINNDDSETEIDNDEIIEVETEDFSDYDYAFSLATDLYGGDDTEVTTTDNGDSYLITVKDKDGNTLNTFEMSKEDGTVSEIPISYEETETSDDID